MGVGMGRCMVGLAWEEENRLGVSERGWWGGSGNGKEGGVCGCGKVRGREV